MIAGTCVRRVAGSMIVAGVLVLPMLSTTSASADVVAFSDGFESGTLGGWTVAGAVVAQKSYVRSGLWAAQATSTGSPSYLRKTLSAGYPVLKASVAFDVVSQGAKPVTLLTLRNASGGARLNLGMTAKGLLTSKNFATGVTTTSTATVTKGSWHTVALAARVGAAGRVDVVLDGTPVAALSQDVNLGTAVLRQVELGDSAKSRPYKVAFDDALVTTADKTDKVAPTVPTGVTALQAPTGDRVTVAWQPSTDAGGIAGYDVYRDGTLLGSVGLHTVLEDSGLVAGEDHSYTVVARDRTGNVSAPSAVAVPVAMQPAENPDGPLPPVGAVVQAAWPTYTAQQREQVIDEAATVGLSWLRIGVSWARLQPRKPTATDDGWAYTGAVAVLDSMVARAHDHGLMVHRMVNGTPNWANGAQGPKVLPTDPADYATAVQWLAARYAGSVQSIEVYNEPNLDIQTVATPESYTQLLCAAYPAIHAGSPDTVVVSGATAGNDWQWYQDLYAAGARGCFDVLATHPYQAYSLPPEYPAQDAQRWWTGNISRVRDVMVANGDESVPVWFTEFGWSTHDNPPGTIPRMVGVTEAEQATYSTDMIKMTMRQYPYVQRVGLYEMRDENTDNNRNNHYGLYRLDMTAKPLAQALHDLITSYATPPPDPVP